MGRNHPNAEHYRHKVAAPQPSATMAKDKEKAMQSAADQSSLPKAPAFYHQNRAHRLDPVEDRQLGSDERYTNCRNCRETQKLAEAARRKAKGLKDVPDTPPKTEYPIRRKRYAIIKNSASLLTLPWPVLSMIQHVRYVEPPWRDGFERQVIRLSLDMIACDNDECVIDIYHLSYFLLKISASGVMGAM